MQCDRRRDRYLDVKISIQMGEAKIPKDSTEGWIGRACDSIVDIQDKKYRSDPTIWLGEDNKHPVPYDERSGWGIARHDLKRWCVVFGDNEMWAQSGIYRNKRRAKKEVTHYLEKGMHRGIWHGIHKEYKEAA